MLAQHLGKLGHSQLVQKPYVIPSPISWDKIYHKIPCHSEPNGFSYLSD